MSYSGGWRPHIESALSLDLWRLHRLGIVRDGARGGWQWTRDGESFANLGYAVTLHGWDGTLTLEYTHTNRDGERGHMHELIKNPKEFRAWINTHEKEIRSVYKHCRFYYPNGCG